MILARKPGRRTATAAARQGLTEPCGPSDTVPCCRGLRVFNSHGAINVQQSLGGHGPDDYSDPAAPPGGLFRVGWVVPPPEPVFGGLVA